MVAILLPKEIHIGGGALKSLPGILRARGFRAPILITDPFILTTAIGDEVLSLLRSGGLSTRLFSGVVPDPTTSSVYAAVKFIAQDARLRCGDWRGSAIDTAKAAALLVCRGGKMAALKSPHNEDTRDFLLLPCPPQPVRALRRPASPLLPMMRRERRCYALVRRTFPILRS
jgi:alcohol dehydrogenase class IV